MRKMRVRMILINNRLYASAILLAITFSPKSAPTGAEPLTRDSGWAADKPDPVEWLLRYRRMKRQ